MTVSYVRSPSFHGHSTFADSSNASPPQSPIASCSSSATTAPSPISGLSSPRAVSRTPASVSAADSPSRTAPLNHSSSTFAQVSGIVVPNDRMEAGLSLRRTPNLHNSEPHSAPARSDRTWDQAPLAEDLDNAEKLYEPALLTGDLDLDGLVYRYPYIDRAFPHSKRRSQLIFDQKLHQHRSAAAGELQESAALASASPRTQRTRRPETAPNRSSTSPRTPEFAATALESGGKGSVISTLPAGLRELTTGASALPASKRASWTRRSHQFEALSDSHHSHNLAALEPAAPISVSTTSIKASRRHSSFLDGEYRSAASLMPVFASNSFTPTPQQLKRRSDISSANSAPNPTTLDRYPRISQSSKRDSMLSNGSSATSSSKGEFEADDDGAKAQSSASSRSGHETSPRTKSEAWEQQPKAENKVGEVFMTPRSSAEHEKEAEAQNAQADAKTSPEPTITVHGDDSSATTVMQAHESSQSQEDAIADATITEPKAQEDVAGSEARAAPAIPSAVISTAVVPPTPTEPDWKPSDTEAVSPTSSPVKRFKSLHGVEGSPSRSVSSHSIDSKSSPNGSPFGSLSIPNGRPNGAVRRSSAASIGSASSTSTYRIRRKAVPSDADNESERRPSYVSGMSEPAEFSPQSSPAQERAPLPPSKDGASEGAPTPPEKDAELQRSPKALPAKSPRRPTTAATAGAAAAAAAGLGLGFAQQPQGSASTRNLSATEANGTATPTPTRTASRATIKRPTTAPVGSSGQFRSTSDAAGKSVLEVEGQQFFMGKEEPKSKQQPDATSPSIPNAVRFMQYRRDSTNSGEASVNKHESILSARRQSGTTQDTHQFDVTSAQSHSVRTNGHGSSAGGWGLEQELSIVDKVAGNGPKPRPASMDKSKKALDAAAKANLKNNLLMNIINEDESDEVKAAAREAGIPEGSYAIHPPSMLQLFEASQCVVYNQEGEEVIFGDLFKKRRTLVYFLRHWWCGFCQQFAMSVRNIDPLPLKKANLDFVIVGQGDWHVIKAYREVMQVQYPMFADPKRNVYRALGMTLRTNEANPVCARPDYATMSMTKGILVAIKKGLFDMPIRNPGDMKLLGGDFILGPGLQCSFTHRMTTADGHMDLPRILAQAGCDLSLKTPKPLFTSAEKEARAAMLAGGNQSGGRQTRSLGRLRGKKTKQMEAGVLDGSFGSAAGSAAAANGSVNSRFARPSLWSRFPGRFSKSQASLPTSGSMVDVSTDFGPSRGLAAGPRSASAMRKISYDGRVRDSFETQQTDLVFESRANSIDIRGRPSDASAPTGWNALNKAQSMSELRKRFQMGSSGKAREPKASMESNLTVPSAGAIQKKGSSRPLRAAAANGTVDGATKPNTSPKQAEAGDKKAGSKLSVFRNNVISRSNTPAAAAATGLGIAAAADEDSTDATVGTATGDKTMVEDISTPTSTAPKSAANLSAPGSFLMDLDVYDSLSRQPSQKYRSTNSKPDSGLSPSQFSDGGFAQEAADADSDTEPASSPARSQRSPTAGGGVPSNSSSFYSFNTFRGKTNLGNLPEEAGEEEDDDDDSDEMGMDEPILFDK